MAHLKMLNKKWQTNLAREVAFVKLVGRVDGQNACNCVVVLRPKMVLSIS